MIFKSKRWFHHLTQKIFSTAPSRKSHMFTVPTFICEEYTEEELALMNIPIVCDLRDDNWTPTSNQKTQCEQEV